MQSTSPTIGVFLIHGFLGSPDEWNKLVPQLQKAGYKTHVMTQLGHGVNPEHRLKDINADAILKHCQDEYALFAEQCDQVVIIGHSMGGIGALWLAGQQVTKLMAVLAFATPYEHAYGVNYAHGLLAFNHKNLFKALRYAPEFLTGYARPVLYPWWFPQLRKQTTGLLNQLHMALLEINVPVWLAHSPYDIAIPYSEMAKIEARINKPDLVQSHTIQECGHQVFVQTRPCKQPHELTFEFLETLHSHPLTGYTDEPDRRLVNISKYSTMRAYQ